MNDTKHYDLCEVCQAWRDAYWMPTKTESQILNSNFIIDENMSVKWNREEVIRRNKETRGERATLCEARAVAIDKAKDDCASYIVQEWNIPHKVAKNLIQFLYDRDYDDSYTFESILECVEEICRIFLNTD